MNWHFGGFKAILLLFLVVFLVVCCFFCYSGSETYCHHSFFVVFLSLCMYWSCFNREEKNTYANFCDYVKEKQKCHICIFWFLAESFLFFHIRQTTKLSRLHAAAMTVDDQTGPGQLPPLTATLAPSTVLCVRFCLFVVVLFLFYHLLLLQSDTAVLKHFYPSGWVEGGGA